MLSIATPGGVLTTAPQVLQFAAGVGNDYDKVANKAIELGLNNEEGKTFLAEVFGTDVVTVGRYMQAHAPQSSNASLPAADQAQTSNLADPAIALTPSQAAVVFQAVHGAGNPQVLDVDIQAWLARPRTAQEMLAAMVEHQVSAVQVGRALGLSAQRVQEVLVEYGLDAQTLVQKEVQGWSAQDVDHILSSLPEKERGLADHQDQLAVQVGRMAPLRQDARRAQEQAAQLQGEYEALNAVFEPAFAEYNALAQQRTALEAYVRTEQGQLAQGQDRLAHLYAVQERRMRRNTAGKEAQYQIANATQGMAGAQLRIEQIHARMSALEVWGRPLTDQTRAAQAQWEQAAAVAAQKSEIAQAQDALALEAADAYRAAVTGLAADHGRLVAYLQAHLDLKNAQQLQRSIDASMNALDRNLHAQRQWSDAAREQGAVLDEQAVALETQATALKSQLDPLQPARLDAEALIQSRQIDYDAAQGAEHQAQADLDAAYQRRTDADYQSGKGARNRARDEANRLIEFRTQQLAQATQSRKETEAALSQALAQGEPARLAALQSQGPWQRVAVVADEARQQALMQTRIGGQLLEVEQATQMALAHSAAHVADIGQIKVGAARTLLARGALDVAALDALEKDAQVDLRHGLQTLHRAERSAVNDREVAGQEQEHTTALQGQAYGRQLIAQNLAADAAQFQQVYQDVDVAGAQAHLAAAHQGLVDAQLAVKAADMHLDWAQSKVDPKKQRKALGQAQPALDAAKAQLSQAQQDDALAQARLSSAQHLSAPLGALMHESGYAALSALQSATVSAQQAHTQGAWAQVSRTRDQASDAALVTVQNALVEQAGVLAQIQDLLAKNMVDAHAAQRWSDQSQTHQTWAQQYATGAADLRQARRNTEAQQADLDALHIQAAGMHTLRNFLDGKAQRVGQRHDQAQAQLPVLEQQFQSASALAQTDRGAAELAYGHMVSSEKNAQIEFIASRYKAVTTGQASADPDAFIKHWDTQALSARKTENKQLHWLDDTAQFIARNSKVQAAREQATVALQAVRQSSQAAVDAGEIVQAHTVATALRARQLLHSFDQHAQAAQQVADLGAQVAAQTDALGRAVQAELLATQKTLTGRSGTGPEGGDAQLMDSAQISAVALTRRAAWITGNAQQRQQSVQALQADARAAQARAQQAQDDVGQGLQALNAAVQLHTETLAQALQTRALTSGAMADIAARTEVAKELHEQRVRSDRVEKSRKKKSLFATLVHAGSLLATAALTFVAPPLGLTLGQSLLAATAVGVGVNAAAQGVNLAAGFQSQWDTKSMVAMASVGLFGAVMGTVTNTVARLLRGTVLGNAVPGAAAVRTLVSASDPLVAPVSMAVVTTQPAVEAIAAGPLSWVGTALGWGSGATAAGMAQQVFEVAIGQSTKFQWKGVELAALSQAMGGVLRTHLSSSWAGSPFAPTLYRPMSLADMAVDIGKRVTGTVLIDAVLSGAGLIDRIDAGRLAAVGVSRGVQVLNRDALGRYVLTPTARAPGEFVASTLGQSLIRSGTYLSQSAVSALLGSAIDWNSVLYLGVGRATGQLGSSWGEEKLKGYF